MKPTLVQIRPMTNAERQRRFKQKRREAGNASHQRALPDDASNVTVSTPQMCALAARLASGNVTPDDARLASRLIMALVDRLPRNGTIELPE